MVTVALAEPLGAAEAPIFAAEAAAVTVANDTADTTAAAAASAAPPPNPDPTAGWPTYLLQFMHRFLDMREAEAQACAALAGVPRELLPLDLPPAVEGGREGEEKDGGGGSKRCGFLPALPQAGDTAMPGGANAAFRTIRLPGPEAAAEVLRRSMLVRCILDVWGEGDSMDSLCADLRARNAPARAAALGPESTWRLSVDGFGVAVGSAATLEACAKLSFLNFPGKVNLDDPDAVLRLIVIGGKGEGEEGGEEEKEGEGNEAAKNNNTLPLPPALEPSFARRRYILGLEVGTRLRHNPKRPGECFRKQKVHARDRSRVLSELSLPKRPYIGPTSMDAEVAAIMCNLALVRKGSVVLDPCVGTGSILVAAAAAGAHVMGCDIDLFALVGRPAARAARPLKKPAGTIGAAHQKGQHGAAKYAKGDAGRAAAADAVARASVGLLDNFEAYGFARPAGVLVADMSRLPFRRRRSSSVSASASPAPAPPSSSSQGFEGAFDAIIADPPYGVRAGGRKQAVVACGGGSSGGGGGDGGEKKKNADDDGDGEEEKNEQQAGEGNPPAPASTTSSASHHHHHHGPRPARANARFRAEGAPAPTAPYELGECLWDLLRLAASSLSVGGRLVFFLPARPGSGPEALPRHPCLRVVADCEQPLTRWYCRRLVAMEKWRKHDSETEAEEAAARSSAANLAAFAAATAVASGAYGDYGDAVSQGAGAGDGEGGDGEGRDGSEEGGGANRKKKKGGGGGGGSGRALLKGRGKCV